MKNTMKKYFSILLAIMMLVTSFSFSTSAAGDCQHQTASGNPNYCKVVNPTCEDQGYTILYCIWCGDEVARDNYKDALGHKFAGEIYSAAEDGSYRKYSQCERKYTQNGQSVTCGATVMETEDGNPVVYYRVDFVNNWVTESYDDSIEYTKVVASYKSEALYTTYVKEGGYAYYDGTEPYREKTKAFAKYGFRGWTEEADLDATAENTLNGYDAASAVLNIAANKTVYPVFEGLTADNKQPITHPVRFYTFSKDNAIVPITEYQYVLHGSTALFSYNGKLYDPPVKAEDNKNTYEFAGWSTTAYKPYSTLISNEDIESTPIYGAVNFYPVYNEIAKNYTIEFRSATGKHDLLQYTTADGVKHNAVFDGVHAGTHLLDASQNHEGMVLLNNDAQELAREADEDYIYIWNGKWAILNADDTVGRVIDLTYSFDVYNGEYFEAVDTEGNKVMVDENGVEAADGTEAKKIIRLVPVYETKRQLYAVDIEMQVPYGEDEYYNRSGADVHVTDSTGQLVASGLTDANGMFRCFVYHQTPLTVTVATSDDKYLGTAQIYYLAKAYDGNQDMEASLNKVAVSMTLNPEYESHCSCIHHNPLLTPIWVRILNILYNLFNVKYVCCYDMYSSIGELLDYTA